MTSQQLIFELVAKAANSFKLCGSTRVITIDGPAGSGKTTLAQQLSVELENCPVIHMDDLYEGWEQDLIVELPQRILAWIITPLENRLAGQYLRYNWFSKKFDSIVKVPIADYLILEGVGAGHPLIQAKSALNIWVEADPEILLPRLVKRDGEDFRADLIKWQSHESKYFEDQAVRESADFVIRGD